MKVTIFVVFALFGVSTAGFAYQDSEGLYYGFRLPRGDETYKYGDETVVEGVPSHYQNPYPYIRNVWGVGFPDDVQRKAQSMEWEHNKILRSLTQRYVEARKAEEKLGPVRNFTAGLIYAPYEREIGQISVHSSEHEYTFQKVQTHGLQYFDDGAQYMIANYETHLVNLTFYTQKEVHVRGEYCTGGQQCKNYDIWTKSGGTNLVITFGMVEGEYGNGVYRYDLENVRPKCYFEPAYGYESDGSFPSGHQDVFEKLYEKLADNFCEPYVLHVGEKINYLLQWNSPAGQYNSVLNRGMLELMMKFRDAEIHQTRDINVAQGTIIQHAGYDIVFTGVRVIGGDSSDFESGSGSYSGSGSGGGGGDHSQGGGHFYVPIPSTHQMKDQLVVTDVMLIEMKKLDVELTVLLRNGSYTTTTKFPITVIDPTRISLSFFKHYDNEGESIHLGVHPGVALGGTHNVVLHSVEDAHIRNVLEGLKPVYHSIIGGNFIGYLQYRLFHYFYPSYFPTPYRSQSGF